MEKQFNLSAKLTEKNLGLLENLGAKDNELGLATPAMAVSTDDKASEVKKELPSLSKLEDMVKAQKTA